MHGTHACTGQRLHSGKVEDHEPRTFTVCGAFSGNAIRGLTDFNSNLAAGEYGNYFNRLASIAGVGQAAANNGSQMSMTNGQNIGNIMQQQGNARASGIQGQADAWGNALDGVAYAYGRYQGRKV